MNAQLEIAIPVFDGFTALDAIGPFEVLSRLPGARVRFVAHERGHVRSDNRMLTIVAEAPFEAAAAPDVLVVPGGFGTRALLDDERILGWIEGAHATTRFTTSVCTGALLLGAAGILEGLDATTHWLELERLVEFGARPVERRVVFAGRVITAAGVSAGIDMALSLAALLAGERVAQGIQLSIEYDPRPPFDGGSARSAPPEVVAQLRDRARKRRARASSS